MAVLLPSPYSKKVETAPANGLEALAEEGNPTDLGTFLSTAVGVKASGVFNTPVVLPILATFFPEKVTLSNLLV